MESNSIAALREGFGKHLEILRQSLEKLDLMVRSQAPAPTSLLHLPIEIRLQIYSYCIPQKRIIAVADPHFTKPRLASHSTTCSDFADDIEYLQDSKEDVDDNHNLADNLIDYWNPIKTQNSIFLLSKRISEEALDVLYGDNVFKLYLRGRGETYLGRNFSRRNRQRMKQLLLIAQPRGVTYTPRHRVHDLLWRSILPHLKVLRIVAEQPVDEERRYYNAPTYKQEMDHWINWFLPYMQFFGQYLVGETRVEVDANDRVETEQLITQCLPYGYQKVQCHLEGDHRFKRGRYSLKSGCWDDDDGPLNSRDV